MAFDDADARGALPGGPTGALRSLSRSAGEWAIEVKMLRLMGDNGKPNDNMLMHILSPYERHRSASARIDDQCRRALATELPNPREQGLVRSQRQGVSLRRVEHFGKVARDESGSERL